MKHRKNSKRRSFKLENYQLEFAFSSENTLVLPFSPSYLYWDNQDVRKIDFDTLYNFPSQRQSNGIFDPEEVKVKKILALKKDGNFFYKVMIAQISLDIYEPKEKEVKFYMKLLTENK